MKLAALALALLSVVLLVALVIAGAGDGRKGAEARPASGMALLNDWRCRRAETKEVLLRGMEDDYSGAGKEQAAEFSRLPFGDFVPHERRADYDESIADAVIADVFDVSSRVASGVLVFRARPFDKVDNDGVIVGDFGASGPIEHRPVALTDFNQIVGDTDWRRAGDLFWVPFAELRLNSGATLLAHIRAADRIRTIGVKISDDTMVDFMGAAVCVGPSTKAGMTFALAANGRETQSGLVAFYCHSDGESCDPFAGDTPCDSLAPLLCFREQGAAAPLALSHGGETPDRLRRWSGGEVAATEPLRASDFATVRDADRACADRFGEGWRVADWHLGGGFHFSAASGGRRFAPGRYWIDIKDQPYGTCWSRGHDE